MPGSGSDPGVILRPGSCIPAVFWLVGIQLVVSQRIPAEMCSTGLKYWVVGALGGTPPGPVLMQKNRQKMFPHPPAASSAQKSFKTEPEPQTPALFVFAPKTYKKPNALRFQSSSRSPPLTNPTICSLHVTPESPSRHEPNLHS